MRPISMERIRQLDAAHGEEIKSFRRGLRLETIFHADNLDDISATAERLKISREELSSYVWFMTYIGALAFSCEDVPSPEVVAEQFGISWEEFESYFLDKAEAMDEEDFGDDDFRRPRQKKLPIQTLDPWEEDEDILDDLQEDSIQGD